MACVSYFRVLKCYCYKNSLTKEGMEEESVKKKIFVVLLSAVLCLQGLSSTDTVMAEEAVTTVDEAVVEIDAEDTLV